MSDLLPNRLAARQTGLNAGSRTCWELYRPHRDRITDLLLQASAGRSGGRLCVLGAGNLNDLDLRRLHCAFSAMAFLDLDGSALAAGLARQGFEPAADLEVWGGADLSGVLDLLEGWSERSDPRGLLTALTTASPPLPAGPFEVVLSAGLLTQMIDPLVAVLEPDHPLLPESLRALRRRHLEIMLDLLVAGGTAILVSDLVSSDSVPGLAETPQAELRPLLLRLLEEGNFFSGANPFALLKSLREDPALARRVSEAGLADPWLWPMPGGRCALAYGLVLKKVSPPAGR